LFPIFVLDDAIVENDDVPDDKRLAAGRYAINIVQCALCTKRQANMCGDFFLRVGDRDGDGAFLLSFFQCVTCISGSYSYFIENKYEKYKL